MQEKTSAHKYYFIAVFIVLELVVYGLLGSYFNGIKTKYLAEKAAQLETQYKAAFNSYSLLFRTLSDESISSPDLVDIFKDAYSADETGRAAIRERLLAKINPVYRKLTQLKLKILQFHLPDGTSFLRVHRPSEFGDNLFAARYSVRLVNTEKKYIEGFEAGKLHTAFRFISPLFHNGKHIGSVETGFAFAGLKAEMEKLFPAEYFLIIKKDIVEERVLTKERSNYPASDFTDNYFYDTTTSGSDTAEHLGHLSGDDLKIIGSKTTTQTIRRLEQDKSFAVDTEYQGDHYVLSFLPIKGIGGKTEAYMISLARDLAIDAYGHNFQTTLILATLLLIAGLAFIYARQRAEASLEILNEELRTLIDASPLAIVMIDREGNLTLWNPAAEHMFGWSAAEVLGRPLPIVPADRHEEYLEFIQRSFCDESIRAAEILRRRKDGSLIPISLSTAPLHDQDGNITAAMGVLEDISERKKAEKALSESKQMLEDITEGITDGILLLGKDYSILWANKASLQQTGLTREELVGNYCFKATHAQDFLCKPPSDPCPITEMMQTGRSITVEHTHCKADGSKLFAEVSAYPIKDANGEVSSFVHITRDITRRRQLETEKEKLEAQCQQLQKAESLGRMAGAIAHNFNNMLAVVIGHLEFAMGDLPPDSASRADLAAAMRAANRAAEVSKQMLTYLGHTPGRHEELDLAEACRKSLPMLHFSMPEKVKLTAELPSSGPVIKADVRQLSQVLTNLTTNAWEAFGEEGEGTVTLTVKTVPKAKIPAAHRFPLNWQPQDDLYACLEIMDEGCGIAQENMDKLFDPFFTTKFTGRGLGLPVVLGIVRAHHGAVAVESEKGRGSVFMVFWPLFRQE